MLKIVALAVGLSLLCGMLLAASIPVFNEDSLEEHFLNRRVFAIESLQNTMGGLQEKPKEEGKKEEEEIPWIFRDLLYYIVVIIGIILAGILWFVLMEQVTLIIQNCSRKPKTVQLPAEAPLQPQPNNQAPVFDLPATSVHLRHDA